MKVFTKILSALMVLLLSSTLVIGQVIFEDDFEAYTSGGQVACQNSEWTTWSNAPCGGEDAYISSLYAHSGVNSAVIAPNNDLVNKFGDPFTAGAYKISMWVYIPTGKAGYFNTLAQFSGSTSKWGLEVYFNQGGDGSVNGGGTAAASFTWTENTWFEIINFVDLDADYAEFWVDGNAIWGWQWSLGSNGVAIPNTLDANDFFGATANDQMFIDDYKVEELLPIFGDPPTNLTAEVSGNDVHLEWDAPGGGGTIEELIYDNDVSTGAYSYNGYTMSTHMSPAGGCKVLKMKFYTTVQAGANDFNATLFEWAGSQPGTTIIYEESATAVDDAWMEVDISGQNITFTGDFVVGFGSVNATTFLGYDANLNNGRSWDFNNSSPSWAEWNEAYLIRAIVEYTDGTIAEIGPQGSTILTPAKSGQLSTHPTDYSNVTSVKPIENIVSAAKDLLGYNIYRDYVEIDFATGTSYDDLDLDEGTYEYFVTAVYDEGESEPSNTVNVTVSGGASGVFSYDFENYVAGQQVACQTPDEWTTWSNSPCSAVEDAYISTLYAHSGVNSVVVVQNNDLVKDFGTAYTTGKYKISFWVYIPTGKAGYFNTLAEFAGATSSWGLEVYFNQGGDGSVNGGGTAATTFFWDENTWFLVENVVDLDEDWAEFWIDGNMIWEWQWSLGSNGVAIPNTLDANDFFGATAQDQMFFDDYMLEDLSQLAPPTNLTLTTTGGNVVLNWVAPSDKSFNKNIPSANQDIIGPLSLTSPFGPNYQVKGELDCPEGSIFDQSCVGYSTGVTSEVDPGYRVFQYSPVSGNISAITFWGIKAWFNGTAWVGL